MKRLAVLTILTLFIIRVNAQQDIRFGIQLSPTFSWMNTDDNKINSNGTNLGIKIGLVGEYQFRENYALVSGLTLALNAGGTLKHEIGGSFWPNSTLDEFKCPTGVNCKTMIDGINLKYGITYVEIPLGLKMRTNEFGYVRYFAELPVFNFGFRTSASGSTKGSGFTSEPEKLKISDDVNPVVISWGFGGGIEYTISQNTVLVAGLYYQRSFTDVTRDDSTYKAISPSASNPTSDPAGDWVTQKEDSKGNIGAISIRLGVLF